MSVEITEFSERCETMECTNSVGKQNQCYDQSYEKFNGKYHCEEHMKKVKADYAYEHAVKCERSEPQYIKENGKYKRVVGDGTKCKKVASKKQNDVNYCNECFAYLNNPLCKSVLRHEPVPGFRMVKPVICNKPAKEGEIYCSDCMTDEIVPAWKLNPEE